MWFSKEQKVEITHFLSMWKVRFSMLYTTSSADSFFARTVLGSSSRSEFGKNNKDKILDVLFWQKDKILLAEQTWCAVYVLSTNQTWILRARRAAAPELPSPYVQ
jgi:hypothetical protein